jgi:hypothetical protein
MDRVDTPITKPLPYFWSFLSFWKMFHDHRWTKWKFTILVGTPKTKKQEEDELVQRGKKTFRPLLFSNFISFSFLVVLNNGIWSFTKPFWSAKTIEWHPKILSSRIQTGHMCQPYHVYDPLHVEKAYFVHSFIDLSDFFCIGCAIWSFTKPFGSEKIIEWHLKILSFRIQIGHMCQPTSCPWPPFIWKRHILLIPSSIWGIVFTLDAQFEALQNLFEVKRQKNDIQKS